MTSPSHYVALYGYGRFADVTEILSQMCCKSNGYFQIPITDVDRAAVFGDPDVGVTKFVLFKKIGSTDVVKVEVNKTIKVYSDVDDNGKIRLCKKHPVDDLIVLEPEKKLCKIQNACNLIGGSFSEEFPEQLMVAKFLPRNAKVLEIGANIGRNTLVISSLLDNSFNCITMESDPQTVQVLELNRQVNEMNFQIENSALSIKPLIQSQWNCSIRNLSEPVPNGSFEVQTITWSALVEKYQIEFDTLVLDCEGSFYYILHDFPEMLQKIKLIIMENDYWDANEKKFVDQTLTNNGFTVVYNEAGGWGPCQANFFQVWAK